jgi:hypothetical protein
MGFHVCTGTALPFYFTLFKVVPEPEESNDVSASDTTEPLVDAVSAVLQYDV